MIENGGAGKTLTAERGEYVREKTAVARLERLEKEGSLVPADEVMLAWGQYTANATTVLLAIPSDIGAVWSTIKSAGQAADEVGGAFIVRSSVSMPPNFIWTMTILRPPPSEGLGGSQPI